MNSISIDGKSYSKATDIARELGYTADYVGQLCRARKVDAQLVGRSWYVSEESIRNHKKSRYRNDKKAAHAIISKTLHAKDGDSEDSFSVSVSTSSKERSLQHGYSDKQFYKKVAQKKPAHAYYKDDSELIPVSISQKQKEGSVVVQHADAKTVKIVSNSKEYDFDPTPRPEIRFSGALKISEVDYDEEDVEASNIHETTEDVLTQKIPVQRKLKKPNSSKVKDSQAIKVVHKRTEKKKKRNLPTEHNDSGIIGMTAQRISDRNPRGGTLKVAVPTNHFASRGVRGGRYILVATFVCAVFVSTFMLGLQSVVLVQDAIVTTSYFFEFEKVIATVSSAW
jgi:hypothetical protein